MSDQGQAETHLINGYLRRDRGRKVHQPLLACERPAPAGDETIDLYIGGDESQITCADCRAWLADPDNRLLLLETDEWVRKHAAAGDRDLWYTDIPEAG
jgi:hypothetical protein